MMRDPGAMIGWIRRPSRAPSRPTERAMISATAGVSVRVHLLVSALACARRQMLGTARLGTAPHGTAQTAGCRRRVRGGGGAPEG